VPVETSRIQHSLEIYEQATGAIQEQEDFDNNNIVVNRCDAMMKKLLVFGVCAAQPKVLEI
jgi:hypothetical protein